MHWDIEADIVVVGFGAAGACAALEAAAAGRSVAVLDRFTGGGATALSGGVVYAGGGTPQQRAAGVTDTAAAMFGYLRTEVGDVVPPETLRQFCDESVSMLGWLESHGVPFEGSLCPDKTSYPTNRHYLYYSGSEMSARDVAPPAPRGHRTRGRGTSGGLLFARLAAATRRAGVQVVGQTKAVRLILADGRAIGVECRSLRGAPWWARSAHRLLHRAARKPFLYVPKAGRLMHRPAGWLECRYGRPLLVGATRGVVIAAGGFGGSRELLRAHAPSARGGLPLATPGDDGSGLLLGTAAGGAAALLDRVSVWRFLSPPPALLRGVLVDADGKRICDESRYGAAIGDEIVRRGGRAWLFADQATITAARRQLRGSTLWFQRLQARYLLTFGRVTADTVAGVAARAGVDPDGLAATVAAYNATASSAGSADAGPLVAGSSDAGPADTGPLDTGSLDAGSADAGRLDASLSDTDPSDTDPSDPSDTDPSDTTADSPDPAGKPADLLISQDHPPYSLIDYSIRARLLNPAPVLTLGGLVVDDGTGQVLRADGTAIPGLYAAGRSAVGLCSRSYVSGLSIADCVFSGRRAGRHASAASPVTPSHPGADEHERQA